jgi:hypothetical protein
MASATGEARAISWCGATAGVTAVAGQVIGGLLLSAGIAGSGRRPASVINVPSGLVAPLLVARVPAATADRGPDLDRAGTARFGVAIPPEARSAMRPARSSSPECS